MAKILIIDDVADIVTVLAVYLRFRGHQVIETTRPEAAEALVTEHEPDIVLLDYAMPGSDGVTVMKRIWALPVGRDLPIILISGVWAGMLDSVLPDRPNLRYLEKPFEPPQLQALIKELLCETAPRR